VYSVRFLSEPLYGTVEKSEQCEVFGQSQNIEQFEKVNSVNIVGDGTIYG
jgi:hypothetical protein